MYGTYIIRTLRETRLATNKSKVQTMFTSTVFKFVQNKCTAYMNEVFRPAENIRINTRKSCLKLNHPFRKTNNLNTFKFKMKHHYLNDLIQTYEILVDLIMLWLS